MQSVLCLGVFLWMQEVSSGHHPSSTYRDFPSCDKSTPQIKSRNVCLWCANCSSYIYCRFALGIARITPWLYLLWMYYVIRNYCGITAHTWCVRFNFSKMFTLIAKSTKTQMHVWNMSCCCCYFSFFFFPTKIKNEVIVIISKVGKKSPAHQCLHWLWASTRTNMSQLQTFLRSQLSVSSVEWRCVYPSVLLKADVCLLNSSLVIIIIYAPTPKASIALWVWLIFYKEILVSPEVSYKILQRKQQF